MSSSSSASHKIAEALRHSVVYGLGSMANSVVGFFLLPILTNSLTVNDFGIFSLVQMVSVIAGSIFYLGMTSALPRSYFDYSEAPERKRTFSTCLCILLLGAMLQVGFGFALKAHLSTWLFGNDHYQHFLFLMLCSSALGFISQIFFSYLRFQRKSIAVILFGLTTVLVNLGGVYVLLKVYNLGIAAPIYTYLGSNLLTLTLLFVYCRETIVFSFNKFEAKTMLRFGTFSVLAAFAVMSIDWIDRLFINKFLSISDVGIYSLAFKVGSIVNIIIIFPFTQIWNPMMMEYRTEPYIAELFKKITTVYVFTCGLFMLIAVAFLEVVLDLLIHRPQYKAAFIIAPIIMLGLSVYGLTNILSAGLFYSRKIGKIAIVYYAMAILNAALNFLLIPTFGFWGAAISSLATYFLIPIVVYQWSKHYFPIEFEFKKLLLVLCVVSVAVSLNLYAYAGSHEFGILVRTLAFFIFSSLLIYYCLDLKFFKGLIRKTPN